MNDDLLQLAMTRAIDLSRQGFPAPNPRVGCVIVRDGQIVGEGYHDHAGSDHAEVVAIKQAGTNTRGSEMFVTLEPCHHQGRTPPCSRAILHAGIHRVHVAVADPNPIAQGGAEALREHGIAVEFGLMESEARAANRIFLVAQSRRRPFVAVKAAITLDGFIARLDGTSKWITGELARLEGHRLRAELGCVLVGRRTVHLDDPELTARIPGIVNQPERVVMDPMRSLDASHKVFQGMGALRAVDQRFANDGDLPVHVQEHGIDLAALLEQLFARGIHGVLVEGGAATVSAFLNADLVDEIHLFQAGTWFNEGISWTGSQKDCTKSNFRSVSCRPIGEDQYVVWRRVGIG